MLTCWAFSLASFFVIDALKVLFFSTILGEKAGNTISFDEFVKADDNNDTVGGDGSGGGGGGDGDGIDVEAANANANAKKRRMLVHQKSVLRHDERKGHALAPSLSAFQKLFPAPRRHEHHI